MATHEWERRHEEEWTRIDRKLRRIAVRRAALDAEEANLLRYAEELKLWRGWGFGSMLEYMERAMGYAPHTAGERLRVARALAELPLLAEALECGQVTHSAIRELSRVAVPETEATGSRWRGQVPARDRGRGLRPQARRSAGRSDRAATAPQDDHARGSPESYDIWRKLHALAAEEHGQRLSDDELIPALFRRAYCDDRRQRPRRCGCPCCCRHHGHREPRSEHRPGADVRAARYRHLRRCHHPRRTERATATFGYYHPLSHRARPQPPSAPSPPLSTRHVATTVSSPPTIAQAVSGLQTWLAVCRWPRIDVDPAGPSWLLGCGSPRSLDAAVPERATTIGTPRKREQVLARDGHCCTVPGYRRNVGLDLHHIEVPRATVATTRWPTSLRCAICTIAQSTTTSS